MDRADPIEVGIMAEKATKKVARSAEEVVEQDAPAAKKQKTAPQPSHTLYVKNLNDKLNKKLLKEQLYILFSTYGEVIDITVVKNAKMRGQAHVAFTSVIDASLAMRALQDDVIFGKPMVIQWAKKDSKVIDQLSSAV